MFRLAAPLALAGLLVAGPAGAAPLDPRSFMPGDAGFVVVWKNPNETLRKVETLAAQGGSVPPGVEPGWLWSSMTSGTPMLADVDLSRPVWMAGMPPQKGSADADSSPALVVVVPVKGKGEKLSAALAKSGTVTLTGTWLVGVDARLPKTLAKPQKRPFRFPKHSTTLHAASDIAGYLNLSKYPAVREMMKSEDAETLADVPPGMRPLVAALQKLSVQQWEETAGFGFGAGVTEAGLDILFQNHPEPNSKLQKRGLRQANYPGALVHGLPAEDYILVIGSRTDPRSNEGWDELWASLMGALTGADATITKKIEEFQKITKPLRGCSHHSAGVLMPGEVESLRVVSASRCKSASAVITGLNAAMDWTSQQLTEPDGEKETHKTASEGEARISMRRVKEKRKVNGVALDQWQIDMPSAASDPDLIELAVALKQPFAFGAVDATSIVLMWNAPDPLAARLVQASKKKEKLERPASLAASQSRLLDPRSTEAYLFASPLVTAFTPPSMAQALPMFRMIMAQMPPLAMATQTQPDGSQLYQLFLPQQLAQLAATVAQMQQQPGVR